MEKKKYILCPRCELNYIDINEKYCDVCKAELGLGEASFLLPDEEDESEGKLCPICHTNYCEEGEDMCIECKKEHANKDKAIEPDSWEEEDEDVATDLDSDLDDVTLGLDDDEEEEEENEEPEASDDEDDFEYINPDDFSDDDDDESDDDDDEGNFI